MVVYLLKVYANEIYEGEHQYDEIHDNKETLNESIDLVNMEGDLEYEVKEIVVNQIEIG